MNYLEQAKKKVESIFAKELSKEDIVAAIQELFEKELIESFKNGIEVGMKRGSSQPKDAKKEK